MTILLVEDDPVQREMTGILLRRFGYEMVAVADGRAALMHLQDHSKPVELAILDIGLPGIDGLELLELIRQRHPTLPCLMLTGNQEMKAAMRATELGAYDYLNKPVEPERLQLVVANALKTSMLEREVTRLKRKEGDAYSFENLIGFEGGLTDVVRVGRKAAASDIPVLLSGETGTGKEVVARAIHGESHRAGKPFVAVNCGALPANLIESILFGHEKGAFTGAIAKSIGKFREAHGGTIFLDEVGDLPLDAQVKLLRVLQQKEITPVGADHSVAINVRVISATHRTLEQEVAAGRFREDLFFRLNVLSIHIPPLRERSSDIPELARHFIERFSAAENRRPKAIPQTVMDMLVRRRWDGNVRELENALHRAMVIAEGDAFGLGDFSALQTVADTLQKGAAAMAPAIANTDGSPKQFEMLEREALQYALQFYEGNVTQAAKALGLAKSTYYRRMKDLGIVN